MQSNGMKTTLGILVLAGIFVSDESLMNWGFMLTEKVLLQGFLMTLGTGNCLY